MIPGFAAVEEWEAAVCAFIDGRSPWDFASLALGLARWQHATNADYAACGPAPARVDDIPAVPVALFRDLPLTCFPPQDAAARFRTSGTTGPRGTHRVRSLGVYDHGARRHAEAVVGPIPRRAVSLVPSDADSSLGHMCRSFVDDIQTFFTLEAGVDALGFRRACAAAPGPVFVPGTAFAFAAWIAADPGPLHLPPGSVVMVTGGFKGRRLAVGEADLAAALRAQLPGARLVGEYGMTELSSQLWAAGLGEPFVPPPWMRVVAVDPWTGAPAARGVLRFLDLANVSSVCCIETRDIGEVDAEGRVTLHGRLAGDHPRGCSLSVEEALLGPEGAAGEGAPAANGPVRWVAGDDSPLRPEDDARAAGERGDSHDHSHGHDPHHGAAGGVGASGDPRYAAALARVAAPYRLGQVPPPRGLRPGDAARVARVEAALGRLAAADPTPWAQGLSPAHARDALSSALGLIDRDGLARALAAPGPRPASAALVIPWGVFTMAIEWVALLAAAGVAVHLKAPARGPESCAAIAAAFQAEGLSVQSRAGRALPSVEVIVAFADDPTIDAIRAAHPGVRVVGFGHRFSVHAVSDDPGLAQAVAWDIAWYDTRGCMAPAATFVRGGGGALAAALPAAMRLAQFAQPRGPVDAGLGPEWRRRVALARRHGSVVEGDGFAVVELPARFFTPVALPRMAVLHPVADWAELGRVLAPWRAHLGTLGTDVPFAPWTEPAQALPLFGWFTRVDTPGVMQRPPFPRVHDGVDMLAGLTAGRSSGVGGAG